jgi:CDP-ribitol ribitolphosphotransferase
VVQLWHGCGAFKTFSCTEQGPLPNRIGGHGHELYRLHPTYSRVYVSGRAAIEPYARSLQMTTAAEKARIKPLGVSRSDVFYDDDFVTAARAKVRAHINACAGEAAQDKRIILYAPTYRDRFEHPQLPPMPSFDELAAHLGEEYVCAVKQHPSVAKQFKLDKGLTTFMVPAGELSIDELICGADVLVTDYSSVVFEWSLFDKPLVFFAPDLEQYERERGLFYTLEEFDAGDITSDTSTLVQTLHRCSALDSSKQAVERIRHFKERFMSGCDGKATKRIVEDVAGIIA